VRLFIVTGAGGGLGAEIAARLTARGEQVIGTARRAVPAAHRVVPADLSRPDELAALARALGEAVRAAATSVVLVSNAGTVGPVRQVGGLADGPGDWSAAAGHVAVNYTAPVVLTDAVVAALPDGATLEVVNITSGAAERPIPGWSLYCSSKKAAKTFLDVLAAEHPRVTVRHVDPGVMDTGMQAEIRAATAEAFPDVATFRDYHGTGRLRGAGEVARTIVEGLLDR